MLPMSNAKILARLLRHLAREVESLSDEELAALAEMKLPLLGTIETGLAKGAQPEVPESALEVDAVVSRLKSLTTRADGEQFITRELRNRNDLLRVARALDIPVTKRHTVAQIEEKIVEATIGFRTRSAAIRGDGTGS